MNKTLIVIILLCFVGVIAQSQLITSDPLFSSIQSNVNGNDIFIDFSAKQCYERQYLLQGGQIELSFHFTAISITISSGITVAISNQNADFIPMIESGNKITIKKQLPKGSHAVKFCPSQNTIDTTSFVMITNVVISEKQCFPAWSRNFIVNGGFQQGYCLIGFCIFNASTYKSAIVPGWISNPEIEIGTGSLYNVQVPAKTKVTELDANANTCVKQILALKPGKHSLSFNWAARQRTALLSNGIAVKINGNIIKTLNPSDYNYRLETIDFNLPQVLSGPLQLQFCGVGTSDSVGSILDNVKLIYQQPCPTFKINTY